MGRTFASSPPKIEIGRTMRNVGHVHGGFGRGSSTFMVVIKATYDMTNPAALGWALNVAERGDRVIVLGVMNPQRSPCNGSQWRHALGLVCPVPCKLQEGSHRFLEEQVSKMKDKFGRELVNIQQLCNEKGVTLEIMISRGHPLKHVAVRQAIASKAEWVILDRDLRKTRNYFKSHLNYPCNLVLMTITDQGSIITLGPGYRLHKGDRCTEICDANKSSKSTISGVVVCGALGNHLNDDNTDDCSDHTGSGASADSEESTRGGDKNPEAPPRGSYRDPNSTPAHQVERQPRLPTIESEQELEEFFSAVTSPGWSPISNDNVTGSIEQAEKHSSCGAATSASIGSSRKPLCSTCQFTAPPLGPPRRISLDEIVVATNNFSNENHSADCRLGMLYKGRLRDGQVVSVKRLNVDAENYLGDSDFRSEIEILSKSHHINVVTLIGFCSDKGERILVFEYACNQALSWHLRPLNSRALSWTIRRKISLETARALRYLHEECKAGSIVHGCVEVNSILLTHDFMPVLCNFAHASLSPHCDKVDEPPASAETRTALGYLAPECRPSSYATTKSDVYSFGILLFELVLGTRATQLTMEPISIGELSIINSIRSTLDERVARDMVDPDLGGVYDMDELRSTLLAAALCLQTDTSERPSMSRVLSILLGNQNELLKGKIRTTCNPTSAARRLSLDIPGRHSFSV